MTALPYCPECPDARLWVKTEKTGEFYINIENPPFDYSIKKVQSDDGDTAHRLYGIRATLYTSKGRVTPTDRRYFWGLAGGFKFKIDYTYCSCYNKYDRGVNNKYYKYCAVWALRAFTGGIAIHGRQPNKNGYWDTLMAQQRDPMGHDYCGGPFNHEYLERWEITDIYQKDPTTSYKLSIVDTAGKVIEKIFDSKPQCKPQCNRCPPGQILCDGICVCDPSPLEALATQAITALKSKS